MKNCLGVILIDYGFEKSNKNNDNRSILKKRD